MSPTIPLLLSPTFTNRNPSRRTYHQHPIVKVCRHRSPLQRYRMIRGFYRLYGTTSLTFPTPPSLRATRDCREFTPTDKANSRVHDTMSFLSLPLMRSVGTQTSSILPRADADLPRKLPSIHSLIPELHKPPPAKPSSDTSLSGTNLQQSSHSNDSSNQSSASDLPRPELMLLMNAAERRREEAIVSPQHRPRSTSLRRAVKRHHCDFDGCTMQFPTSSELVCHVRTHTGERPYKCDYAGCNKAFAQSGGLVRHRRTHTGDKPYKCTFPGCHKSFAESGHLSRHTRTHIQHDPLPCPFLCGRTFQTMYHLLKHKKTHTGPAQFVCPIALCVSAFETEEDLTVHRANRHNNQGMDDPINDILDQLV